MVLFYEWYIWIFAPPLYIPKRERWTIIPAPVSEWIKSRIKLAATCLEDYAYWMVAREFKPPAKHRQRHFSSGTPFFVPDNLIPTWLLRLLMRLCIKKQRCNIARDICIVMSTDFTEHNETDKGPPLVAHQVEFDPDSFDIGIDNRTSRTISHCIQDFDGPVRATNYRIRGFTGLATGQIMIVTIVWRILDDNGCEHTIRLPNSLYVPEGGVRLLSPQHWAQVARDHRPLPRGTRCITYDDCIVLQWNQRKYTLTTPLNEGTQNVGTIRSAPGFKNYTAFQATLNQPEGEIMYVYDANQVTDDEGDADSAFDDDDESFSTDDNVVTPNPADVPDTQTDPREATFDLNGPKDQALPDVIPDEEDQLPPKDAKAEWLHYHHCFGHASPKRMKIMALLGIIPRRLAKCDTPLCTACLFGKATRRPWRTNAGQPSSRVIPITKPGQCVSVDQLISPTPGLIAQLRGIPTKKRYTCATIFVDHFSGYGYVHLQKSTSATETIEAKKAFEAHAATFGVTILHYHADNGVFADNGFRSACMQEGQSLTFCGVNAHFENGRAEKRIRDATELGRTMLIHANRRWPTAINAHLWPFALRHAILSLNRTPSLKPEHEGKSYHQLFSGSPVQENKKHWVPFGCPVYVLDNKLQAQQQINKWQSRARVGIYLGVSQQHSRNIALVLNMQTGLASPQFHVKFDRKFETMRSSFDPMMPVSKWQTKTGFQVQVPSADTTPQASMPSAPAQQAAPEPPPAPDDDGDGPPDNNGDGDDGDGNNDGDGNGGAPPPPPPTAPRWESQLYPESRPAPPSRSGRERREPIRFIETYEARMEECRPEYVSFEALSVPDDTLECYSNTDPLLAYKAVSDPDTMYLHEAMKQPDRDQFLAAMLKEVEDQRKNGHWTVVPRKKVPQGVPVMPSVWSMKRKRRISTREVYKWKARLTLDGSRQKKGVNYWEAYAPVASWPIIRLILSIAIINNWYSKQIDYVLAFPQAKAETDDLYMAIPKGMELSEGASPKDFVLHIQKNIYGQKQGSRVWYLHLKSKLEEAGLKQSSVDDCIFTYKSSIYALYTDDSILTGPDEQELEEIVDRIRATGLDITDEGTIDDFLGVKIERDQAAGTVTLSQPHLAESILKDLRLDGDNVQVRDTPAKTSTILRRGDPESPAFDDAFHYRSVIGKLNYLQTTRPDIAYATHQCARFASDPKEHHGQAVRWLCRYIAGTKDKGITFKPKDESFNVFVDSDFSGNWSRDTAEWDTDTARSRAGFIITYAGCPIFWSSKLMTEISLSTTEAEYIAASESLRHVIPMMNLIKELQNRGFSVNTVAPKVHCKLFEDNSGAIELLKVPKTRARTKHINLKYHFFRQYVDNGEITVHHINTEDQPADMLTKSLKAPLLARHRCTLMGW